MLLSDLLLIVRNVDLAVCNSALFDKILTPYSPGQKI